MELRHLRYFVAVAEELHFSRAAARLNIAQPPLSYLIRQLELELDVTLLERTKRKVVLTDAGKAFLEEARGTLARAEVAVQRAKSAARGEVGHLKVGFVPWADFTTSFTTIIRLFGERKPHVRLDFHSLGVPAPALLAGHIDVAFFTPPVAPNDLSWEMVLADSVVVALPERHPLAKHRRLPLKALAKEAHIVVARESGTSWYELVDKLCRDAGFVVHPRHYIDHPQTTLALVAAGVGVSLMPRSFEIMSRPGVVYRSINPSVDVRMLVAWRPDDRSPVLTSFLDIVREVVRSQSRSSTDPSRPRRRSTKR